MTFRRQLALMTAAAVASIAVVSAVAVYVIVRHQLFDQVNRDLHRVASVHASRTGIGRRLTPVPYRPPYLPRVIDARFRTGAPFVA